MDQVIAPRGDQRLAQTQGHARRKNETQRQDDKAQPVVIENAWVVAEKEARRY